MGVPATSGQFRSNVRDMLIGDYIAYNVFNVGNGFFHITQLGNIDIATAQANEIPAYGASTSNYSSGYAYAIKSDKGILISDRVIINTTYNSLNTDTRYLYGKPFHGLFTKISEVNNNVSGQTISISPTTARTFCIKLTNKTGGYGWNGIGELILKNGNTSLTNSITSFQSKSSKIKIFASSRYSDANYYPYYAFDNSSAGWICAAPDYYYDKYPSLYIDFGELVTIDNYSVTNEVQGDGGTHVNSFELYAASEPSFMKIRSLSGGIGYNSAEGVPSTTNNGILGFPSNNEYDKYIINSDLGGKIIAGDKNVWHWDMKTIVKEINMLKTVSARGGLIPEEYTFINQTSGDPTIGFRPVFEYNDMVKKSSSIWD